MAKAIAVFTGGITERHEVAVREDGAVFWRHQFCDPRYGRRWSRWRATGQTLGGNAAAGLDAIEHGFGKLTRARPDSAFINDRALFTERGELRVRLPN